jgi:GT2 family glycosyltransferase
MTDISQPSVCCVVVNWNGWQDTLECLAALKRQDYGPLRVIVVDNGSTNGSVQRIREAYPLESNRWLTLMETGANLGYPTACNAGTRAAYASGADYLWLLNNDTIAPADTLTKLVRAAEANPRAGAIGAVLDYMHDPAKVQAWGGGSLNLWTGFVRHYRAPATFRRNSFLTGASLLLPRNICQQVGIFYEGFFMYCDDSDFCLRLHRAGFPLVVAPDTAILHKEGGSSPKRSPLIDQFATTSTLQLLQRHAPVPTVSMAIYLLLRLGNRAVRGRWSNLAAVLRGVRDYRRQRGQAATDQL